MSTATRADETPVPEVPGSDRNRNRVWRAMSWLLLVNVLLFWLMTCITAFAQTTASWTGVYLIYAPANGSYSYTQNNVAPPGWRNEGIHFRVKVDGGAIDGQPAAALQKLTLPGLNRVALTTNENEASTMRAQGWLADGTLGYVLPAMEHGSGQSGTPPSLPSAPVTGAHPTVTGFAPASGLAGATITIGGSNFTVGNTVKFNGVASTSVTKQPTSTLLAVVPASATTGKISVIAAGGTATSTTDFVISSTPTPTMPTIAGFTPQSGPAGTLVTVTGTNLTEASSVRVNAVAVAGIGNITATSLQATSAPAERQANPMARPKFAYGVRLATWIPAFAAKVLF